MMALFATWVLLSGLDDLILDALYLFRWLMIRIGRRPTAETPVETEIERVPHKRIAIFVPLWREYRVIKSMVEHNVMTSSYDRVDFFLGVYPNDTQTLELARAFDVRIPNVHVSVCPHDGPTSKADNLNWTYQRMLVYETERDVHFDVVITHDAEDLIHPEELKWANYYTQFYDMVQIPVLPLPTGSEWTHGLYCDEFAEFQSRDMPTRQFAGGFLPSSGVGTSFSRRALDRLGERYANCIFEPKCLTEDYENGFRVHKLGFKQCFIPVVKRNGAFVATRAYFPRSFSTAIKQRTRWVMGIGLQSWELHNWRDTLSQLYWFWRDRKGLVGSLLSPAANIVFLAGVAHWYASGMSGHAAQLFLDGSWWVTDAFAFSMTMQAIHLGARIRFSAQIYGWRFGWWAPFRVVYGNVINLLATAGAFRRYFHAKLTGRPLTWLKTEHAYPNRATLMTDRRKLGEILVGSQYLESVDLEFALASQPPGVRLGEHLIRLGKLTETELYECLSLQQNVAFERLEISQISRPITRALPARVARKWKVLGFKVVAGQLFVASPDVPTDQMSADLRRFSSLEIRFHLVTPGNFERLQKEFLPAEVKAQLEG